ncbi:MAG: hypothetical protein VKN72_24420 [Nostocales cyanobacterium 94392]|nr:hypothetical protein [Nostocales cyanobacterium 94392]
MKFDSCDAAQHTGISGRIFTDRGTGVRVKPEDFMTIISRNKESLVVETAEGFFTKIYKYATAYKGFVFFTESLNRLQFTAHTEIIQAQSISSDI